MSRESDPQKPNPVSTEQVHVAIGATEWTLGILPCIPVTPSINTTTGAASSSGPFIIRPDVHLQRQS